MKSMTAYSHVYKRKNSQTLHILLRSFNFKNLDITVKNSISQDIVLEELIRKEIAKKIFRGKIEIYVFLEQSTLGSIKINEELLSKYILKSMQLAKKYNLKFEPNIVDFLFLPSVIDTDQATTFKRELIFSVFKEGLEKLLAFKLKAGCIIKAQMLKNLEKLRNNILEAKNILQPTQPQNLAQEQIQVTQSTADMEEELSLSLFYTQKLKRSISLGKNQPKGRIIDFLSQEILRELNSALSKVSDKRVAVLLVEAKRCADRIKEQAQNVE